MTDSFEPLTAASPHTLILGTMPGQASLQAAEYYAHPRNALWPVMLAIIDGQPPSHERARSLNYASRCQILTKAGYALWDVLAYCERTGSLDSNIRRATEVPNDIAGMLQRCTQLSRIACNGKTAEKLLRRHILPGLDARLSARLSIVALPSTSPAMASLNLQQKYQRWADGLLG